MKKVETAKAKNKAEKATASKEKITEIKVSGIHTKKYFENLKQLYGNKVVFIFEEDEKNERKGD